MRRPGAAGHADGRAVAGIAPALLTAGSADGRGPSSAAFAEVRLAARGAQPDGAVQAASAAPPRRRAAAAAADRALGEECVGEREPAAPAARAFRRPVARLADGAAVRAPGRHLTVLAAGPAAPGRLEGGRARRAQRPAVRPGVYRARPAAPPARLLPPLPVAVTAEPAVAGAVRQLARTAASQARGHDDAPIPGGGQQPCERDHRLRRVSGPGCERIGEGGQVPVEVPQRPAPGRRLGHQGPCPGLVQAGHHGGDGGSDRSRICASVSLDAGAALMRLRAGAPRCAWPTARAVPRPPPWRPGR
jgi:hypothetical protein